MANEGGILELNYSRTRYALMTTSALWFVFQAVDFTTDCMFCKADGQRFQSWCWFFFSVSLILSLGVAFVKGKIFWDLFHTLNPMAGDPLKTIKERDDLLI